MLNKSAHLDRFVDTHSANLGSSKLLSPRARAKSGSETFLSLKFWGLLIASGFSIMAWIIVFRLVMNFLHG